jgi:hypothetical protein
MLATDPSTIVAYPNPFSENITIDFPVSLSSTDLIYLYDAYGQLISKLPFDTGATQIQLQFNSTDNNQATSSSFPKGVYYISARLNGKLLSKKLIKL